MCWFCFKTSLNWKSSGSPTKNKNFVHKIGIPLEKLYSSMVENCIGSLWIWTQETRILITCIPLWIMHKCKIAYSLFNKRSLKSITKDIGSVLSPFKNWKAFLFWFSKLTYIAKPCFSAVKDHYSDLNVCYNRNGWSFLYKTERCRSPALWLLLISTAQERFSAVGFIDCSSIVLIFWWRHQTGHTKVPSLMVPVATVIGEGRPCNCTDISSLFLWPFCSVGINPVLTLIECVDAFV